MNFLLLFVLIPLVMMGGVALLKNDKQIKVLMAVGSSVLLIFSFVVLYLFMQERAVNDAAMLFTSDLMWYEAFNIKLSLGVDGISVSMLILSAIIVFTGVFASWGLQYQVKEFFLWFLLLSIGVFGFFITVDMFAMFLFYEVALIPMYLLIGLWGTGRKEYSAMKLTLMLMGGSAFLLLGILGVYFGTGIQSMNILEIAQAHIPESHSYALPNHTLYGWRIHIPGIVCRIPTSSDPWSLWLSRWLQR